MGERGGGEWGMELMSYELLPLQGQKGKRKKKGKEERKKEKRAGKKEEKKEKKENKKWE